MICDECGTLSFDDDICGTMIFPMELRDAPTDTDDADDEATAIEEVSTP